MIPIEQVKRGLAKYLDREIFPHINGWQKWLYSAGAMAYLNKADNIADAIASHPMLAPLELIGENHCVDVDALYQYIKPAAEKSSATISLPGWGDITLTAADVDKIYQSILTS